MAIVKTWPQICNSCSWEVEAERSEGQEVRVIIGYKASLDYVTLQNTTKEMEFKRVLIMEVTYLFVEGAWTSIHVHEHMHACGGQRSMSGIFLCHSPSYLCVDVSVYRVRCMNAGV